jgi:hypothetical protein
MVQRFHARSGINALKQRGIAMQALSATAVTTVISILQISTFLTDATPLSLPDDAAAQDVNEIHRGLTVTLADAPANDAFCVPAERSFPTVSGRPNCSAEPARHVGIHCGDACQGASVRVYRSCAADRHRPFLC